MKKIIALCAIMSIGFTAKAQYITIPDDVSALLSKHTCLTCHKAQGRSIGPSYEDIAAKGYKPKQIVGFIYKPKPANWPGYAPMVAMPQVPKADAMKIAEWVASLKKK